jgi:transcriptional regulator with XRE-family HTH domain
MSDQRMGVVVRALRHRRGWRQVDLARTAGLSQTLVSAVERGHLDGLSFATLRMVLAGLDARLELNVRWRGGALDRLLDERHPSLVGRVVEQLRMAGWEARVEASYAHYGERGSVDVLGFHVASRSLLVVEVKSELISVEATLRKLDEKVRLAPKIVAGWPGWQAGRPARLVVLPSTTAARRAVVRHRAILDVAVPLRGPDVRAWPRSPSAPIAGLLFVADSRQATGKHRLSAPQRVRRPLAGTRRA